MTYFLNNLNAHLSIFSQYPPTLPLHFLTTKPTKTRASLNGRKLTLTKMEKKKTNVPTNPL